MITANIGADLTVAFDPENNKPLSNRSGAFTLKDQFGSSVKVPFTVIGDGAIDGKALKAASAEALAAAGYQLQISQVQLAQ